ncbi:probable protein phosphatase 2C 60 [Rhododendron vialii]|uniref:probable protein phosphatase 2C 60 n=1 Tax=Rhododendron vialii TaxID=182163 RepID=UPI00265E8AB9|nr:probable protein phosphatase 2C 60 [Rhododendron vialii]
MGTYLRTPNTEDRENETIKYGLSTMQGCRSHMEDAHAAHLDLDTFTSFFGVYDGHEGKEVALFCAKYLHQEFMNQEAYLAGDLGTSLWQAFLSCTHRMSFVGSHPLQHLNYSHSEILCCFGRFSVQFAYLRGCGQSGNRELAIFRGNIEQASNVMEVSPGSPKSNEHNGHADDGSSEKAYNLTRDHKPNLAAEKDRILKAGGFVRYGRVNWTLNLSRSIGDMELKRNKSLPADEQIVTANPDLNTVELCNDDEFLVIACDGIWEGMSSQQLVDFVRDQLNTDTKLSVVCERVFDRCIECKGRDNMTVILVQFKKPFDCSGSTKEQAPLLSYADPVFEPDSDSDDDEEESPVVSDPNHGIDL